MKNRNVILTAVVMFCALGSAVASKLFAVNPVWVKGTTITNQQTCSTIATDCNNGGTRKCEVRIQLSSGIVKSTNGYEGVNICTTQLTQQTATAIENKPNLLDVATYVP